MRLAPVRALSRRLRPGAERAWVVGGAPRDLLLGRPILDVDVALVSDPEPLARELEREGLGRCVVLSEAAPRVYRVAGSRDLDLARLEGATIEEDLARRDFTVNALAIELPGGRWHDPFGGVHDLARRRLRSPRRGNFAEDPLRVFRAARFLATHGLRADRETSSEASGSAAALEGVAPERIRVELIRLLEADRAAPALGWAAGVGALAPALGVSTSAAGRLRRTLARLDASAVLRQDPEARRRLRLALMADAVGFSPEAASAWLLHRRFSRDEASVTGKLLELVARARSASGGLELWDWVRDAGDLASPALTLWRVLRPADESRVRSLRRRWKTARRGLEIRGSEVIAWSGMAPGPRVGELIRELQREVLRGAVSTRSQARRWVSARVLRA